MRTGEKAVDPAVNNIGDNVEAMQKMYGRGRTRTTQESTPEAESEDRPGEVL